MIENKTYKGTCFCGAVEIAVEGAPEVMGYCHCSSCRHWSAGPVNAFTLWKPERVRVTRGKDLVAFFNKTRYSFRAFCKACGGHLFAEHPGLGMTDVFAAILPDLSFEPSIHINYGEAVLHVRDGLPKQLGAPEMGGAAESAAP